MADVFYGNFVWDSEKNEKNKKDHGISFEFASHVFQDPYLFEFPIADKNSSLTEARYDVVGCVNGVCLVFVACTDRDDLIRIISARKATKQKGNCMKKILREYKFENLPPVDEAELKSVMAIKDSDIDFSEIPEKTENDFRNGSFYYAPSLKMTKVDVHLKLDKDNVDWVQQPTKKGYQTRINEVLRWARLNGCPLDAI